MTVKTIFSMITPLALATGWFPSMRANQKAIFSAVNFSPLTIVTVPDSAGEILLKAFPQNGVDAFPLNWAILLAAAAALLGALLLITIIACRRRAARRTQSLQESEEKYRRFFMTSRNPVFISSKDGQWLDVNDAAPKFFGYDSREEFLETPVQQFYRHPEDRLQHLDSIEKQGFSKDYPVDMVRKDGSIIHTRITAAPVMIPDQEGISYQGTIQDITAWKKTQETLQASQKRLELAVNSTGVGLWDWEIPGGEIQINDRWLEHLGYQAQELSQLDIDTWNQFIHPDDLEKSYRLLARHFAGDLERYECELRMQHKKGIWLWILSRGTVIERRSDGSPKRMLGTYLDITDQVRIKNETREYAEQLEALHEVTGVVSASLSLEEVLDIILDQLSETLDFVSASIFLIKEKGLEIVTVKNHRHPEQVLGKTFPLDNPLFQEMMAAKKPIIIDNAQRDKRFQAWGQTEYVRGWMGIPLVVREQLIGYITLDSEQTSAFGNPESKLAEIFATQAAQAIENAQLYQQIQQYADELEERIEKRTKELSRMVDLMAGREIRMKELKEVIRTLRAQILHAGLDPEADDPLLE